MRIPSSLNALLILFACLAISNYLVRDYETIIHFVGQTEIPQTDGSQDEFLTLYNIFQAIRAANPNGDMLFGYDGQESSEWGAIYRSLNSTYLWWPRYIKSDFPKLDDNTMKIGSGIRIVSLSHRANTFDKVLTHYG